MTMKVQKRKLFPEIRALLVALLCLSVAASSRAGDDSMKSWHSAPDLSLGSHDVMLDGRCLRFSAAIVDSSLAKLHKKRLREGTEFRQGKTVVEQFPDELLVEVIVTDCAAPYGVAVAKEKLASLQFGAAWRHGGEDRPATIFVPQLRKDDSQANDTFRTYEISVSGQHIPLSDLLILTLSSDGRKIADFVSSL